MTIGSGIAIAGMWLAFAATEIATIAFNSNCGLFLATVGEFFALAGTDCVSKAQDCSARG